MRVGRLVREMMRDVDTPARVAERIRYRQIAEKVVQEREVRWPILTAENALDAIVWQQLRIQQLLEEEA